MLNARLLPACSSRALRYPLTTLVRVPTCTSKGIRRQIAARAAQEPPAKAEVKPVEAADVAPSPSASAAAEVEEVVFYEGSGSNAELALSILLMATLIYAPLSIASIGRRLWIKFRFTNKRLSIINTSPLFKRTIEVSYKNVKDIRTAPRAFGAWGDMVIFLRDGSRLELTGVEKYKEIEDHIKRCIYTM